MSHPRLVTRYLLVASLGLIGALNAPSPAFAQDEPAVAGAPAEEDTPIVPDAPFPSLLSLDEGDSVWTLKVTNGIIKVNGDVAVNSTNKGAIWMSDGFIESQNGKISVVGGVSRLGKNTIRPLQGMGGAPISDPLPEFRIPSPGNMVSNQKLFLNTDEEDKELPPGIYNGGIFASGKGSILLQPGIFVIANGNFDVIGPTIEGEGVTIVMAGNQPGALKFSLGAKFNASAPTSGKLKDLLVISRASGQMADGVYFASAEGNMKGIIYAPEASFAMQYSKSVRASKIIAKSVSVTSGNLLVTGLDNVGAPAAGDPAAPAEDTGDAEPPAAQ